MGVLARGRVVLQRAALPAPPVCYRVCQGPPRRLFPALRLERPPAVLRREHGGRAPPPYFAHLLFPNPDASLQFVRRSQEEALACDRGRGRSVFDRVIAPRASAPRASDPRAKRV